MYFSFVSLTKPKENDVYTKEKNEAQHIPFYDQCIIFQENVYNGAYLLIGTFVYFALLLVLIHVSMNKIKKG